MSQTLERLPDYLRKYTVEQLSDRYTPRDHAVWRYIMRLNRDFFKDHAVDIYLKGLDLTGITTDRIPMIRDMDKKLSLIGWGAVPVSGFIPPAAFLEFQALKILPIAFDMRHIDHVGYTPAPDIVHEAAGHAPILADEEYSDYLTRYAAMAQKAIFNKSDLDLYEAIRRLSDTKENFDSTPEDIRLADEQLKEAVSRVTKVSEASKVTRMNWWTVEYGLLGSLKNPKIYGAGLLSSIRESQTCLSPQVKKIRLSVSCVDQPYDITEPQPQLFVAESISHLKDVLVEFESTLAFRRGGVYALREGQTGATVTSTKFENGIEVSGIINDFLAAEDGSLIWIHWRGPCHLGYNGKVLKGQGVAQHPQGFSTVLGRAQQFPHKPLSQLSDRDLRDLRVSLASPFSLRLTTGVEIQGHLREIIKAPDGRILVFKLVECTARRGDRVFFEPGWGEFDWAVGESVVSVCGGPSDRNDFGMYEMGMASTSPARQSPYTAQEKRAFALYSELREKRQLLTTSAPSSQAPEGIGAKSKRSDTSCVDVAMQDVEKVARDFHDEWLLRLESLELAFASGPKGDLERVHWLKEQLGRLKKDFKEKPGDIPWLVEQGSLLLDKTFCKTS